MRELASAVDARSPIPTNAAWEGARSRHRHRIGRELRAAGGSLALSSSAAGGARSSRRELGGGGGELIFASGGSSERREGGGGELLVTLGGSLECRWWRPQMWRPDWWGREAEGGCGKRWSARDIEPRGST